MPPGLGPSECRAGDNNWERLPLLESCWNERSKKMRHASRNRWLQAFVKWILISRSWTRLFCSQKDTLCEYGEVISVDYQVYIICSWTNGWKRFVVNYCAVDGVDNFTSELWTLMFANCSSVGDFRNCFDRTSVSMLSLTHELPCVYRSESLRWEKSNLSTTCSVYFTLYYMYKFQWKYLEYIERNYSKKEHWIFTSFFFIYKTPENYFGQFSETSILSNKK